MKALGDLTKGYSKTGRTVMQLPKSTEEPGDRDVGTLFRRPHGPMGVLSLAWNTYAMMLVDDHLRMRSAMVL